MKTNQSFDIRHKETGELLASVPAPLVYESDMEALPGVGQYLIIQIGEIVTITTTIDSQWLMDENRSYPIMIDPTLDVRASNTYYSYSYRYQSGWYFYNYEYAYSTNYITYTCKGQIEIILL